MLLSAILLFSVQPLLGKLLLPLLGGSPSVWNTVMVFFQAMLLAGYAYAHFSFRSLGMRWQPLGHLVILGLAALQLPFGLSDPEGVTETRAPALWVLLALTKAVGLPVFILASTAPLLQRWFATSSHKAASDPYFLYAASNLGSFGALLAYPLLIEPTLRLKTQGTSWAFIFWGFTAFIAVCAALARLNPGASTEEKAPETSNIPIPRATVWKWIGLSFIPSSLMLGVTNYITTDVASLPLLWVIPLGLYLFTFVIAFGKRSEKLEKASSRAVPILALAAVFPMLVRATEPVWVFVLLHLLFFFFAALQCHLRLAAIRPPARNLTAFYLYLALGGVLGGIFNALVAPMIFSSVAEYPLMIVVATFAGFPRMISTAPVKAGFAALPGTALVIVTMAIGAAGMAFASRWGVGAVNAVAGLFLVGAYLFFRTPSRYALALGVIFLLAAQFQLAQQKVLAQERNFFGVLRVTDHPAKPFRQLYHGTTIHGMQNIEQRCQALSYYHPAGPVQEIDALFRKQQLPLEIGLVGLGAGAILAYAQPPDNWTLYEIDPAVVRIAQDTNYFTFLSHCTGQNASFQLGDARLKLQEAPEGHFGLLYIDAFSSDVIPMHLLTVEAFRLYLSRLAPEGILALHVSSRHFSLEPLVANLAKEVGRDCYRSRKGVLNPTAIEEGGIESVWVIVVPNCYREQLATDRAWTLLAPNQDAPLWSDDFSSLAGVLRL